MSTALEMTGFFMCLVGWIVTGLAVANDYWKISSLQGTVIVSNRLYENLWHACGEDSSGKANCQDFQSMLALPGRKQIKIKFGYYYIIVFMKNYTWTWNLVKLIHCDLNLWQLFCVVTIWRTAYTTYFS